MGLLTLCRRRRLFFLFGIQKGSIGTNGGTTKGTIVTCRRIGKSPLHGVVQGRRVDTQGVESFVKQQAAEVIVVMIRIAAAGAAAGWIVV